MVRAEFSASATPTFPKRRLYTIERCRRIRHPIPPAEYIDVASRMGLVFAAPLAPAAPAPPTTGHIASTEPKFLGAKAGLTPPQPAHLDRGEGCPPLSRPPSLHPLSFTKTGPDRCRRRRRRHHGPLHTYFVPKVSIKISRPTTVVARSSRGHWRQSQRGQASGDRDWLGIAAPSHGLLVGGPTEDAIEESERIRTTTEARRLHCTHPRATDETSEDMTTEVGIAHQWPDDKNPESGHLLYAPSCTIRDTT